MKKNPLTTTVIVFAIGDGYTMWQAVATRTLSLFTAIAWVQGIVLLILYLKKSPLAGSYLIYSVVPLFPIYFLLTLTGITAPPKTPAGYLIAFAIYVVALPLLWKQKREYDRYILADLPAPTA
ncbi:MAG TPA: hypothetical protein VGN86_10575 [Pyrinomonadaceae bacterium]|jgi:hypothetical protein|nr:hypothetical protein [Pyrinomonadaceae bacterium]